MDDDAVVIGRARCRVGVSARLVALDLAISVSTRDGQVRECWLGAAEAIVAELTGTHLLSLAMSGECELPTRLPQMWHLRLLGLVHERVRTRLRLTPHSHPGQ